MVKKPTIVAGALVLMAGIGLSAYAAWYSYNRQAKIAQVEQCNYGFEHPKPPTMMTAPDGTLAPVYSIEPCVTVIVPPPLWDLVRGRIAFENIPERMKVNPYSLTGVLLGRYTLGPDIALPCDQSATTTDCSALPPPQSEPQPYVPPNPVQPTETWVSATGTPLSFSGFSFMLPPGWHGSVYEKGFAGGVHALVQSDSNDRGFTIDCPPDGKGLEAATRLSSEERSFTADGGYSVAFEKWTAPGNDPWYFVWVRAHELGDFSTDASNTVCLAQGSATPDIEEAMRAMYSTWGK
ncbi:hypothetical protein HY418_03315 [Candidatus Kaiserbacteria bacterium]|nr:hypothetical protein [Candidatus Kaiserbacteria bacterium]